MGDGKIYPHGPILPTQAVGERLVCQRGRGEDEEIGAPEERLAVLSQA